MKLDNEYLRRELEVDEGDHPMAVLIERATSVTAADRSLVQTSLLEAVLGTKSRESLVAFLGTLPTQAARFSVVGVMNGFVRGNLIGTQGNRVLPDSAVKDFEVVNTFFDSGRLRPDEMLRTLAKATPEAIAQSIGVFAQLVMDICALPSSEHAQVSAYTEVLLSLDSF